MKEVNNMEWPIDISKDHQALRMAQKELGWWELPLDERTSKECMRKLVKRAQEIKETL
jgi:hypothetical protein